MTPDHIDDHVRKLIEFLDVSAEPIYLDVTPEPYARVVDCFPTIEKKIQRDGGDQALGWQIWRTEFLVEAEFHAVWLSPSGKLRDITPKQIDVSRILFLPDPSAEYTGVQVDNVRLNITDNRLVDDFIEISKTIFRLQNKGDRAFQYELVLSDEEARVHQTLQQMKLEILSMLKNGCNRNSSCYCDSGARYKHCHGKKLGKQLERI